MGGLRVALAVLALVAAAFAAGTAVAGGGEPKVKGARYAFAASTPRDRASGSGSFDRETAAGGSGRVRVSRRGTRVEARVRTWKLSLLGDVATLVLHVEVVSSTDQGSCPLGARGVTTLFDSGDATTKDRVRVAFAGGRCAALARAWAAGTGGARARVRIDPVFVRQGAP